MVNEFWPGGPKFIKDAAFPIGTDAVMLYDFALKCSGSKICDLGCGSGVIGIMLALKNPRAHVLGVELQKSSAEIARENAALNGISDRFSVTEGDMRSFKGLLPAGEFDLTVSNPPYFPENSGRAAKKRSLAFARSEGACTLLDVCSAAAYITRWGGRFALVHKPERMAEAIYTMHSCGLEPKRLRFVCHRPGGEPNLVLIEGRRGGKPGLTVEAPMYLTDASGGDTPEVKRIYHREN
jgi:tRNA1Val (adenine37-N6)-methyltransferase